jgi:hypothetical protein
MNNVRAVLTAAQWNAVRTRVCDAAYNVCQICGGVGPKHPVECHEIWDYNDKTLVQKLTGMLSLCPVCHRVKHIGFAQVQGKGEQACRHLMKINKLTKKKAEEYIAQSFEIWAERSKKQWTLDISILSDYSIDVSKIKQRTNKE